MKKHQVIIPPEDIYPIDKWKIIQKKFTEKFLAQDETMFATANGYMGMRGNFEEGKPYAQSGTFINGFYESWPIPYGEKAYGFAECGQSMVQVPEAKIIKIYVDDEPLYLPVANLKSYDRTLDMKEGILSRELIWETPTGKQVLIKTKRIISLEFRHLAVISYEVTMLNDGANIILSSKLVNQEAAGQEELLHDPRKSGIFADSVFDVKEKRNKEERLVYGFKTKHSGMTLACGIDHRLRTTNNYTKMTIMEEKEGKVVLTVMAEKDKPLELIKYISYHTSRSADPVDLCDRVERTLNRSIELGLPKIEEEQKRYMADFWQRSDIVTEGGHVRTQQVIRFNLFHVFQAAARAEGTGVGARGLTGSAYDGHYFWDTEIYVLPFLIYTSPRIARNLLKFRYSLLDKARERAVQVNQKGALFPWRTINGQEASAFFAAGTAQYHINADIMYAMKKYVNATGDFEFLYECGAEMLIETARLWVDLGCYPDGPDGQFHIHGVTGPDEYTALVNNNLYTNMMARENLRYAVEVIGQMQEKQPDRLATLLRETGLMPQEVNDWERAAEKMYIPYDDKKQIHSQDDNFLGRAVWDFENTPESKYPLLLHYHPLVLYRHQVIKQADVEMVMFLLNDQFSLEEKKRNFDYYDPITTGDSSLSACIQGIISSEIGEMELAVEYFRRTVLMDFGNYCGNVADGAHIAAMGGAWMSFIYGVAGMRDVEGRISFDPKLSGKARRLKFSLNLRGQMLEVDIRNDSVTYTLTEGEGLDIRHKGERIVLTPGVPVVK